MTNEEKAKEICARNAANCCRDCDDCTGGREFYNLVEMAAWKDEQKIVDDYVRIKRFQANEICTNCENYLAENGYSCAFRSLGNDYCWEEGEER